MAKGLAHIKALQEGEIMSLTFVNYLGKPLPPPSESKPKPTQRNNTEASFHKGFRVVGVTTDALKEAQANHQKTESNSEPFDANHWLMNARKKAIRSKPYEVKDAAEVCADLARKAGWLAVEVREIKRE